MTLATIRLDSLGHLVAHGYAARLDCGPCGRGADLDVEALIAQLGGNYPLSDIRKHASCPHCGGAVTLSMRRTSITAKPDGHPMAIPVRRPPSG